MSFTEATKSHVTFPMVIMVAAELAWLARQPSLSMRNEIMGKREKLCVKKTHFLIELGLKVKSLYENTVMVCLHQVQEVT